MASTIIFSFYSLLSTKLAVKTDDPRVFSIGFNLICGVFALVGSLFERSDVQSIPWYILLLTFAGTVAYGIFARFEFLNARETDTSTRVVFHVISPLVATFIGFAFYQESVTVSKILGIVLIVLSNTLAFINFKSRKAVTPTGWRYMLLTYIPLGIAWSIDKTAAGYFPVLFYSAIAYILPAFYTMLVPWTPPANVIAEIKRAGWKGLLLSVINVVGYYLLVRALIIGDPSRVSFVESTQGVLAVGLGIVLLGERKNIKIKILASAIAFLGIVLIKG